MDAFLNAIYGDPMRYIGYVFAFFGFFGILLFIAGFWSGIPHLFTYGESASHMEHARGRIVWGLLWCMVALGLWEVVRVIAGQAPLGYLILSLVLLTPLWVPWLKGGGKGGH